MAQTQIPNSLKRILIVSLLFIFISSFVVVFMGWGMYNLNDDIKKLNKFLKDAEGAQPNFEKSLEMYTEKTKDIIEYLLELRPSTEEEYVEFISKIEKIADELSLNIDLRSTSKNPEEEGDGTLSYSISFYGGLTLVNAFLSKLEGLPYFIKVDSINFKNPKSIDALDNVTNTNVKIGMKLYTK